MKKNQIIACEVPIREGLWTRKEDGKTHLLGSRCLSCGEVFFPRKLAGFCTHCHALNLQDIVLGRLGRISSFTVVMIPPAGGFYHGAVPYAYGCVELPEGVRVRAQLAVKNFDRLTVGMEVITVVEKLHGDENGRDVVTFRFKAIED